MTDITKQTVIVVHGTWNKYLRSKRSWYEHAQFGSWHDPADRAPPDVPFTAKLDEALQERGSRARCWAHCGIDHPIFEWWPGENSWIARANAASALADYVTGLCKDGWLCHIVAHSHGGNVVVQALPRILPSSKLGTIVTMGTPFMDTTSPVQRGVQRRERLIFIFSMIMLVCLYLLLLLSLLFAPYIDWDHWDRIGMIAFGAAFITAAMIKRGWGWFNAKKVRTLDSFRGLRLFVLSSPKDEAWQVLHHLQTLNDPLAVKSSFIDYFRAASKAKRDLEAEISRLRGSTSFENLDLSTKLFVVLFHVFLVGSLAYLGCVGLPDAIIDDDNILSIAIFQIAVFLGGTLLISIFDERAALGLWSPYPHFWGLLTVLFSTAGTYVVRREAWSVLQGLGMGLDGYSYQMPTVEQRPSNIPDTCIHYEEIRDNVLELAMEKRGAWLLRHLGEASQTFSKLALTPADLTSLLQNIETDQSLVHAAYYTEEDCVRRIADWIASDRILAGVAHAEDAQIEGA